MMPNSGVHFPSALFFPIVAGGYGFHAMFFIRAGCTGDFNNQSPKPGESNFGSYQNFGELRFTSASGEAAPANYRRELDIARAAHTPPPGSVAAPPSPMK